MRTLILAALALVFGVASASAECNWQQTAAKSSVVAKSDGATGAGATAQSPRAALRAAHASSTARLPGSGS